MAVTRSENSYELLEIKRVGSCSFGLRRQRATKNIGHVSLASPRKRPASGVYLFDVEIRYHLPGVWRRLSSG
jgi:hypothetical protein